jgi:hypothetical protein
MASGPALTMISKYEPLSDLYLALWKQLDMLSEEGKWLELRPENPSALNDDVRQQLQELSPVLGELSDAVYRDFEKTQEFVFSGPHKNDAELASFRDYLRDHALRYADLVDQRPTRQ